MGLRPSVYVVCGAGLPVPSSQINSSLRLPSICLTQLTTHMFLSLRVPQVFHNFFLQKPLFHSVSVQKYCLYLNRLMATASRQPPWQQPTAPDADLPRLVVYNSLTRSKVPFVPIDWKTKSISWYNCGPTT